MPDPATNPANDPVSALVDAVARQDVSAMRGLYAPDAVLVTMSPNTFHTARGPEAIAERLAEWFASWEEGPRFTYLRQVREGDHAAIEFERTSRFEGADWVVRQAHHVDLGEGCIRAHRVYCTGAREGAPDLAGATAGGAA